MALRVPVKILLENGSSITNMIEVSFKQISESSPALIKMILMDSCLSILPDIDLESQVSCYYQSKAIVESRVHLDGDNLMGIDSIASPEFCTVVSGYWPVRYSKYNRAAYDQWFETTLAINMPYVFYTQKYMFPTIQKYRAHRPTALVEWNFTASDFRAYSTYSPTWFDPYHMPAPELGVVWLEKVNLLYQTAKMYEYEYYVWVDAAIASFRNKLPPQEPWSEKVLRSLPKDRISYSIVDGKEVKFHYLPISVFYRVSIQCSVLLRNVDREVYIRLGFTNNHLETVSNLHTKHNLTSECLYVLCLIIVLIQHSGKISLYCFITLRYSSFLFAS
jgi:hypothetical protein